MFLLDWLGIRRYSWAMPDNDSDKGPVENLASRVKRVSLLLNHNPMGLRSQISRLTTSIEDGKIPDKLALQRLKQIYWIAHKTEKNCQRVEDQEVRTAILADANDIIEKLFALSEQHQLPLADAIRHEVNRTKPDKGRD